MKEQVIGVFLTDRLHNGLNDVFVITTKGEYKVYYSIKNGIENIERDIKTPSKLQLVEDYIEERSISADLYFYISEVVEDFVKIIGKER